MEGQYQYLAFISHRYQGKGREAAERLVAFLHHFRTPRAIRRKYPLVSRRLTPVYYSPDTLDALSLYDEMPQILEKSRFLLVVCTPDYAVPSPTSGKCYADIAAASFLGFRVSPGYAHGIPEQEIEQTAREASAERKMRILPVVFRDKESGMKVEDCLSPLLYALHIIAPDTGEQSEKRVFLAVAARLLGLPLEELYSRWEEQEQRRRKLIRFLSFALAILLLCLVFGCWDYYAEHYSYFTDYEERNHIPCGINEISEEQTQQLESHYRITTQRHRIIGIEHRNAEGRLTEVETVPGREPRPAAISVQYNARDSRVDGHIYYDSTRYKIQERRFQGHQIIYWAIPKAESDKAEHSLLLLGPDFPTATIYPAAFQTPDNRKVKMGWIETDEQGYVRSLRFRDAENEKEHNRICLSGYDYERDAAGRVTLLTNIQPNIQRRGDTPGADPYGIVSYRYRYNEAGQLKSVTFLDAEGPCIGKEGYSTVRYSYNPEGNIDSIRFTDEKDEPCTDRDGIGVVTIRYDKEKRAKTVSFFDDKDEPCFNRMGYACVEYRYNRQGRVELESYYDTEGKPCFHRMGFSVRRLTYDTTGRVKNTLCYDRERKPCRDADGVHRIRRHYDEHGRLTHEVYDDENFHPTQNRMGYAFKQIQYDDVNSNQAVQFFNAAGQPCCNQDGIAMITFSYTKSGLPVFEMYYDAAGKECSDINGIPWYWRSFDEHGNLQHVTLNDKKLMPVYHQNGFSEWEGYYDTQGRLKGEKYNTVCRKGYAQVTREFDAHNNIAQETYLDEKNQVCCDISGVSSRVVTYDRYHNMITLRCFRPSGELQTSLQGYACWVASYNKQGRMLSQQFYDTNVLPVRQTDGISAWHAQYDQRGNRTEIRFVDEYDKPCSSRKENAARIVTTYDERDRISSAHYYDENNHPRSYADGGACMRYTYDVTGAATVQIFSLTEDAPGSEPREVLRMVKKYNPRNLLLETQYFDDKDTLGLNEQGISVHRLAYDDGGRLIEESFADREGKPCNNADGYAKVLYEYDSQHRLTAISYRDSQDKSCLCAGGYARLEKTYTIEGYMISEQYLDREHKPCMTADGYARTDYAYGKNTLEISRSHYDTVGKLCNSTVGVAKTVFDYDEFNHLISMRFENAEGVKTKNRKCGYAVSKYYFSFDGRFLKAVYYDAEEAEIHPGLLTEPPHESHPLSSMEPR